MRKRHPRPPTRPRPLTPSIAETLRAIAAELVPEPSAEDHKQERHLLSENDRTLMLAGAIAHAHTAAAVTYRAMAGAQVLSVGEPEKTRERIDQLAESADLLAKEIHTLALGR